MLRQFSSDGVHIAYIDVPPEGHDRGEPILLIHGFASNHRVNWVNPRWVETLTRAGRRVVAFDNRGHGASQKLYAPHDYRSDLMARDAANLLAHLGIGRADVMGYSMGARIAAFLTLGAARSRPLADPRRPRRPAGARRRPCRSASRRRWRRRRSTTSPTRCSACSAPSPTRRRATAPRSPPASAARARA